MKKEFNYKALAESVKDVDIKSGIVTGYLAAFDNIDNAKDMIVKGAFTKTISERGVDGTKQIKHIFQHDTYQPLGVYQVLKEDKKGLYFEALFSKTQKAQDILLQYGEGIYNEHSIGYRTLKEEVIKAENGDISHFILKEVKLWEGSTVLFGCNDQTPFTGFKSENREEAIEQANKRLQKCINALKIGNLSDEAYEQIEIELMKAKQLYNDLLIMPAIAATNKPSKVESLKKLSEILTIK